MSDPRAIQKYGSSGQGGRNLPAASIMTPSGPAIIQVIDMGGGGGPMQPYQLPPGTVKPGGIHILSAILRRWWLVLLVTAVVGGGGFVAAGKFVKQPYVAQATLRYAVMAPPGVTLSTDPAAIVRSAVTMVTGERNCLLAAEDPDLQQSLPWLRMFNLNEPAGRREVTLRLKGMVVAEDNPAEGLIFVASEQDDPVLVATLCNAFANALIRNVTDALTTQKSGELRTLEEKSAELLATLQKYRHELVNLKIQSDHEAKSQVHLATIRQINDLEAKRAEMDIKRMTAASRLEQIRRTGVDTTAELRIARRQLLEVEQAKDSLLQGAMAEQLGAFNALQQERAGGKTDEHPDVKRAGDRLQRAIDQVQKRTSEIATLVDGKIRQELQDKQQATAEQLQAEVDQADQFLILYKSKRQELDKQMGDLAKVQVAIQALEQQIKTYDEQYSQTWQKILELRVRQPGTTALISIEEPAYVPLEPTADKRTKVQMASCAGGLFLGILLALLVDKFDKRLRDPRDIEPMLGAPVLGLIPRIGELKRAKGEQAKNLIAEEFRIIRTQLLFGNPELQHRTMCVTSPAPGDGKTSLAVNLAISIAKAGRRTLLIDGDLRKPDIHRIFNIPDSPGLAELILGTCEPGAAIRKSEVELLDVLPAGLAGTRPGELLSRPEMARLLTALCELYDHVVFDTAPLLPVSDTHVLAGLVDGVICGFNAEVDRDTVKMVEDILRRCHARLIGTVMNQVKFKQTASYHRGKSAYDSYYSSQRPGAAITKPPGK